MNKLPLPWLIGLATVVAGLVFVFDALMPLGIAGGVPYVGLVLVGIWFPRRSHIFVLALIGSVLTVAGYMVSSHSVALQWVVLTNRLLAILAVWVTAFLTANHKKTENIVRQRETYLRAVMETAGDGIITIDERGTIQTFNLGAEKIFGYAPEEIVGRNIAMLTPKPVRDHHVDYLKNYMSKGMDGAVFSNLEVEGQHKDGSPIPLEITVTQMRVNDQTMFVGVLRDITERKAIEEKLREREGLLAHHMGNTMLAAMTFDLNLRITGWNPAAEGIFGYTRDEAMGQSAPDLIVLDIHLPSMSGIDAIACLREMPETRETPIMALSAAAMPEDIERVLAAGFDDYLTKPLQISNFVISALRLLDIAKVRA